MIGLLALPRDDGNGGEVRKMKIVVGPLRWRRGEDV